MGFNTLENENGVNIMKKHFLAGLFAAMMMVSMLVTTAFATGSAAEPTTASGSGAVADLDNMEVGDIVYIGDIAIERAPDDDEGPSDSVSRQTTEGFKVSSFAGNQSLDKTLSLTSTYRYWFIWVNNTGSNDIIVTIGNDEETQTRNYHEMPKGKYYIWSTNRWSNESHTVSFSNGAGMYGSAAARLCSTLKEAEAHNG